MCFIGAPLTALRNEVTQDFAFQHEDYKCRQEKQRYGESAVEYAFVGSDDALHTGVKHIGVAVVAGNLIAVAVGGVGVANMDPQHEKCHDAGADKRDP